NGGCDDASTHGTVPALAFGQMRAPESRSAARLVRTTTRSARGRRLFLAKGALLAHRLARPLVAGLDDEEQPARHGSALAADRRRAWNSIANVALLRLASSRQRRCSSSRR